MSAGLTEIQFQLLAYFGGYDGSDWPKGASDRNLKALLRKRWIKRVARKRDFYELTSEGDRLLNEQWDSLLRAQRHRRQTPGPDALDRTVPGSYGCAKGY